MKHVEQILSVINIISDIKLVYNSSTAWCLSAGMWVSKFVSWELKWKETEECSQNEETIVQNEERGSKFCVKIQ